MKPNFKTTKKGLVIIDPIERKRYPVKTETSVTLSDGEMDRIPFELDSAAMITTSGISISENNVIYVRDPDGTLRTEIHPGENITLPKNEYILDLSGPMKVYAHIDTAVQIHIRTRRTELSFERPTEITIGARSFHRRPAKTISTTADPIDVMRAVSTFGSALKTTTPERSYPTLRGHPPEIEVDTELSIPSGLKRPQTDITIELPPTLEHIFVVAPLVYYLGAELVPGSTPRLITESGYSRTLDGTHGFEATVERVLQHVFFFDCIVRTEGKSPISLYERQAIEPELDVDIADLYDRSMIEQLETYLEIPFETIEPHVPKWYSEVRLEPTVDSIEFLPFIADSLVTVKTTSEIADPKEDGQESQTTGKPPFVGDNSEDAQLKGGDSMSSRRFHHSRPVIRQCWKNSHGQDVVSTKPLAAFRNSITQSPREGALTIEVVCNDHQMNDELVPVHSTYNEASDLSLNVTVHHDLSTKEFRDVLTKESDFLHYIGHIDSDGFRCANGTLDATTLESVGTKTFFLNACHSYEQGLELIEAGSIGGIVTLTEIKNQDAVTVGRTMARLLNNGFALSSALNVVRHRTQNHAEYHILGDNRAVISHERYRPLLSTRISKERSNYSVSITPYTTSKSKPGSVYTLDLSSTNHHYLVPKGITFTDVSKSELVEFLNKEKELVLFENELRWSTEIKTSEL